MLTKRESRSFGIYAVHAAAPLHNSFSAPESKRVNAKDAEVEFSAF